MKLLISLFLILNLSNVFAFTITNFKSGEELCTNNESIQNEFVKWVKVPVNYLLPIKSTKIYSYTKKPFDKNLPTVLFFTGGPGVSSRQSEFELKNVNVIFFEQRGISCSIPKDLKTFLDPKFYSSQNTAMDASLILKAYNLSKVTVYGHSYGTIPATIFASQFPELTKNVILEGVVYQANRSLWNSSIRLQFFQEVFDSLDHQQQQKILNLTTEKLPINWFSLMGNMFLYLNNGKELFLNFLTNTLNMEEDSLISFIQNFISKIDLNENFYFGNIAMSMIGCQEMSMNNPSLTMSLIITNNKFNFYNQNQDYRERCLPLNVTNSNSFYKANRYTFKVPVFYFLGDTDGATDIFQGLKHWEKLTNKEGKVLILKKGGHLPILGLLKDNRDCDPKLEADNCHALAQNKMSEKILTKIATFNTIDNSDLEELNNSGELKYYFYH